MRHPALVSETDVAAEMVDAIDGAFTLQRQVIYGHEALNRALLHARNNGFVFLPGSGNLGDGLINLGAFDLLRAISWSPTIIPAFQPCDLVGCSRAVLAGGGGWKEGLYESHARHLRPFLEAGGELVILPSTFDGFEEFFAKYSSQITLFARERVSAERLAAVPALAGRVHLCPDLAFAVDPARFDPFKGRAGSGTMIIRRLDGEATNLVAVRANIDLPLLWNGQAWGSEGACAAPLLAAAELISQFEAVETDRLHMAIFSAMLGRQVTMIANSYFKNRSLYNYSLIEMPNVTFADASADDALTPAAAPSRGSISAEVLEKELVTLSRLRREYFEPEIVRLQSIATQLETEKAKVFGPQLDAQRAEIAQLAAEVERLGGDCEALTNQKCELAVLRAEHDVLTSERDSIRGARDALAAKQCLLEAERDRLAVECGNLAEERGGLATERDSLAVERDQLVLQLDRLEASHGTLASDADTLRARIAQTLEPEVKRLSEALAQAEKTRLEWFEPQLESHKVEIGRLNNTITDLVAEKELLAAKLEELRRAVAVTEVAHGATLTELEELRAEREGDAARTGALQVNLARSEDECTRLAGSIEALEQRLGEAEAASAKELYETRAALAESERLRMAELEPEIARLRAHVEHRMFEKETQRLRGRVMVYADQTRRMSGVIADLESKLKDAEKLRLDWYVPELSRLNRIAEEQSATKRDWFDPELQRRSTRIVELETVVRQLEQDKRDWFEPKIDALQVRCAELEGALAAAIEAHSAEVQEQNARFEALAEEAERLETEKRNWFEPQLASQAARIEVLESATCEYEATKRDWFEPKLQEQAARIDGLETILREYEATKRDWFEPKLAEQAGEIAALKQRETELEGQLRRGIRGFRRWRQKSTC